MEDSSQADVAQEVSLRHGIGKIFWNRNTKMPESALRGLAFWMRRIGLGHLSVISADLAYAI
jgi:hypothetical protein